MPYGCSAGCHAPCSSPTLRSGSSRVLHHASFIHSSFVPHSSLLHFSKVQSTTLPILLCSPCLPSPAFRGFIGTKSPQMQACHIKPLHCAPITALTAILLCAPVAGTRRPHPFIRSSFTPAPVAGSQYRFLKYCNGYIRNAVSIRS